MKLETRNQQIAELATPEFLTTLTEIVKLYSNTENSYEELKTFIEKIYEIKGVEFLCDTPYEIQD